MTQPQDHQQAFRDHARILQVKPQEEEEGRGDELAEESKKQRKVALEAMAC